MDNQLQELIELQKEQNQLLKKHLTRIRFSLWALLMLMTLTGVGLGVGVYLTRPKPTAVLPPLPNSYFMAPSSGTLQLVSPPSPADNPFQ
jgi:hypothetical protein